MERLADPTYIGPGKWDTFMIECAEARTIEEQKRVVTFIHRQIDNFRCECRENAKAYMKEHPIEKMIGFTVGGEMIGLLLWMWGFHNFKNSQLKKKYSPNWKEVYDYYWLKKNPNVSSKTCSSSFNTNSSYSQDPKSSSVTDNMNSVKEKIQYIISDRK